MLNQTFTNVWNSQPENIREDNTNTLKAHLEKFWQHQNMLFD